MSKRAIRRVTLEFQCDECNHTVESYSTRTHEGDNCPMCKSGTLTLDGNSGWKRTFEGNSHARAKKGR